MSARDDTARRRLEEADALAAAARGHDGSVETVAAAARAIVHALFGVSERLDAIERHLGRPTGERLQP